MEDFEPLARAVGPGSVGEPESASGSMASPAWATRLEISRPVLMSQTLTVWSRLQDAARPLSRLNATAVTTPAWP